MKLQFKIFLASLFTVLAPCLVQADSYFVGHLCSKPSKPYQIEYQWELDNFNDEVQRYQSCISEFIDEQNNVIRKHQQAADDAIDEWNNFVNLELN